MSAGSVVVTLAAGGLGGVIAKSVYDLFDRKHRERREDQHRFAAIKQEAYAQLPTLLRAYEDAWRSAFFAEERYERLTVATVHAEADSPEAALHSAAVKDYFQALRELSDAIDNVSTCVFTIKLVGSEDVRTIAVEILNALNPRPTTGGLPETGDLLAAFTRAARRDLGNVD